MKIFDSFEGKQIPIFYEEMCRKMHLEIEFFQNFWIFRALYRVSQRVLTTILSSLILGELKRYGPLYGYEYHC